MNWGCVGGLLGAFVVGTLFGGWAEARKWRGKAADGFRMASGHALYEVRKVFDFNPEQDD